MITDKALELEAESAAVTASANTSDYVDFDQAAPNKGTYTINAELIYTIMTTGTGASGTFEFTLEGDDNSSFTSATALASTGAIACASCTANRKFRLKIPVEHERYMRGRVVVGGTGAGAMTFNASIVHLV